MQVFIVVQLFDCKIQEGGDKAGPHIQKVQPVKAVRDDEKKARERIGVGRTGQKKHEESHCKPAQTGI